MNLSSQNNFKLEKLFAKLKQTTQNNKNATILNNILDLINHLIKQDTYLTNSNNQIGLINLQPAVRKPISKLLPSVYQQRTPYLLQSPKSNVPLSSSSSTKQQRILLTKAYFNKYIPTSIKQQQQIQTDLNNSYKMNPRNYHDESILLAYYKKSLYLLREYKNKRNKQQFIIDKNLFTQSTKLDLSHHNHLILQQFTEYNLIKNQLLNRTNSIINRADSNKSSLSDHRTLNFSILNKLIENQFKEYRQFILKCWQDYKQQQNKKFQVYQFHCYLKNKIEQLNFVWNQKDADFRIGIMAELEDGFLTKKYHQEDIKPNFYIYHQFQEVILQKGSTHFDVKLDLETFKHQSTLKSIFSSNSTKEGSHVYDGLRLIKEIVLNNLIYQKNKPIINKVLGIKSQMQTSLYQHLSQQKQQSQKLQKQRLQRMKQGKSFKLYENLNIQNLFRSWNNKLKQYNLRTKLPILCISLGDLYLVPDYKYTQMKCVVFVKQLGNKKNLYESQKLQKNYTYEFDQNTEDWNVKLIVKQQEERKNLNYNILRVKDLFQINFILQPVLSNNNTRKTLKNITGSFVLSKIQKSKLFGQTYEVVLTQQGSQQIVGFLDIFYLIKKQYDMSLVKDFNILNYRNIKVLQKIGWIPPNYYQQLSIGYNPNNLALYSQILSNIDSIATRNRKKAIPIFQQNYQKIYIKLIHFLQNQKIYRRRTKIITEEQNLRNKKYSSIQNKSIRNQFQLKLHFFPEQRYAKYQEILGIQKARDLKKNFREESFNMRKADKTEKNGDIQQDTLKTLIYFEIPSQNQQVSYKTFQSMPQSLKKNIFQSKQSLCSNTHQQLFEIVSMLYSLNSQNIRQSILIVHKNGTSTIHSSSKSSISQLQSFNPFLIPLINRIITIVKHKSYGLDDSKSSAQISISSVQQMNSSNKSDYIQKMDNKKTIQFLINFLFSMYPYFQTINVQKQLLYVRYFIQKFLPQFNLTLNRLNIGLQNLVSKYLLSLFSYGLQQQITFQIWDFIILSPNKFYARINCIITLLIFLQKTNLQPIIPVNVFVEALYQNYKKFNFNFNTQKIINQMLENLGLIYEKQHQRKHALYNMRDQMGELLVGGEFFKKIMFDTERLNKVSSVGNANKANLNNLDYKLPQPKYYGYPVQQIKLFLKGYNIHQTVSITQWQLIVKWYNSTSSPIIINQKNQILNYFIKFQFPKFIAQNNSDIQPLQFILSPAQSSSSQFRRQQSNKFFISVLPVINLHKDIVYNQEVKLIYFKDNKPQLSNKGENILNVSLIMKSSKKANSNSMNPKNDPRYQQNNQLYSSRFTNRFQYQQTSVIQATINSTNLCLQKQYYKNQQKKQQALYNSLLDYNLNQQQNLCIKQMKNLILTFGKMKNPIDQFQSQKYKNLRIPLCNQINFPQVLINSTLLIQHFQSLIYQTFTSSSKQFSSANQSSTPEIYHTKISQLYQLFAKKTNNQMIFLSQLLIESLVIDKKVSLQQKIDFLYCLGKHYQNCYGKGLTIQTVDWIVEYVYKIYGWLLGVNYTQQRKGEIISGLIYMNGVKVEEEAMDITSILKDWAHICKIKYKHYGLALGNSRYLSQLRALLPPSTIHMLQTQNQKRNSSQNVCRIQIIYRKNNQQFIWSATVYCSEFKIKNIGTKFLQKYPLERQLNSGTTIIHDPKCINFQRSFISNLSQCTKKCLQKHCELDTSSQILYNCHNFISLQSTKSITKQQFKMLIYNTPVLCYLLNYSSLYQAVQTKINHSGNLVGQKRSNNIGSSRNIMRSSQNNRTINVYNNKNEMMRQQQDIPSQLAQKSFNYQSSSSNVIFNNKNNNQKKKYAPFSQLKYKDWLKYRYQNCLEQWVQCQIIKIQDDTAHIRLKQENLQAQHRILQVLKRYQKDFSSRQKRSSYQQRGGNYDLQQLVMHKIPIFECWSMQQNLLSMDEKNGQNLGKLQTKRNQGEAMASIQKNFKSKR